MNEIEYKCYECDYTWSAVSEYPYTECPKCQSSIVEVTWQAMAYD